MISSSVFGLIADPALCSFFHLFAAVFPLSGHLSSLLLEQFPVTLAMQHWAHLAPFTEIYRKVPLQMLAVFVWPCNDINC